ncbi:hypothetical protein AYO21_02625 [Fonsecaea monophora]|uniref:Uncharacterized protein n=1 Tax=Fonsecaea monophora TaxID=254056 RepID=A0A177FH31_9EURO|nr:hypothetical protein AYO21_02625 [Fonsecaea monophora]OAG43006.1 hypothetical protein AYO21_02625 [Fonsecaea monophora]
MPLASINLKNTHDSSMLGRGSVSSFNNLLQFPASSCERIGLPMTDQWTTLSSRARKWPCDLMIEMGIHNFENISFGGFHQVGARGGWCDGYATIQANVATFEAPLMVASKKASRLQQNSKLWIRF